MATFYYTGIRLRELVDLTVERAQGSLLRVMGKGRVERDIPIAPQLRTILDAWLAVHPTGTGALFTSLGADPGGLKDQQIQAIVKQIFTKVGLGDRGYTPSLCATPLPPAWSSGVSGSISSSSYWGTWTLTPPWGTSTPGTSSS
ncbi:site-specific tyrosine recombinase XerC [compost metagenome]